MLIPPKRIAMSGGGMLGLAHVGALEVLESQGLLRCVKEYIGISAGSLVSFCICIGYTISEMRSINNSLDFRLMQNLELETIFSFLECYGLDNGSNFEKLLCILLRAKNLSPEITFAEFAKQFPDRPQPRIFATNILTCVKQEFSVKDTPNVQIKFAVLASSCLPFLFTPVRDLSGNVFVDGAVIAFSPFHHLSEKERAETLNITLRIKDIVERSPLGDGVLAYFKRLFFSAHYHHDVATYGTWPHHTISLETGNARPLNFAATSEEKERIFQSGRKSTLDFLALRGKFQILARRNSFP